MKLKELLQSCGSKKTYGHTHVTSDEPHALEVAGLLLLAGLVWSLAIVSWDSSEKEGDHPATARSADSGHAASHLMKPHTTSLQRSHSLHNSFLHHSSPRQHGHDPTGSRSVDPTASHPVDPTASQPIDEESPPHLQEDLSGAVPCQGDDEFSEWDRADLEADMGISGLALSSNMEDMLVVVLIALQAFFLQAMILFFIVKRVLILQIYKSYEAAGVEEIPTLLVNAAVYVHFVNCVGGLPLSFLVLGRFDTIFEDMKPRDKGICTAVYGCIFFVDGLIVPLAQLIIGSLFLCTSATVADLIMNSCAVAFISDIDNTILTVYRNLNRLAQHTKEYADPLKLPVPRKALEVVNETVCIVPFFPTAFAIGITYVGLEVMKL